MKWHKAERKDDGSIVIPPSWLFLHYYDALNVLFRVENSLRVFVFAVLKCNLGAQWMNAAVSSEDGKGGTITSISKQRIAQAERHGFLCHRITSPLMHLSSGELIGLIMSDAYWKFFARYFPGQKEVIRGKLEELSTVRNALAHFRPLKESDVDVVKLVAEQALMHVEEFLEGILRISDPVPTNIEEAWYPALKACGSASTKVDLFQSRAEDWVRLAITFASRPISANAIVPEHRQLRVCRLNTPRLLESLGDARSYLVYALESHYSSVKGKADQPELVAAFRKTVSLVFSRESIKRECESIRGAVSAVALKLDTEQQLIQADSLARGQLLDAVTVGASIQKGGTGWTVPRAPFMNEVKNTDPAEYWGGVGFLSGNFVIESPSFPWMPTEISSVDTPF